MDELSPDVALRRAIDSALAAAERGEVRVGGAKTGLTARDLAQLAFAIDFGAVVRWTSAPSEVIATVTLYQADVLAATWRLRRDGSLQTSSSGTAAKLSDPRRLAAWLLVYADELPGMSCDIDAALRRGQWLRAAPASLRPALDQLAWCGACASLPEPSASVSELLELHGALECAWDVMPPCTDAAAEWLEATALQPLVETVARDPSPSVALWRGAARVLADRVKSRADAETVRRGLDASALHSLAERAQREGGSAAGDLWEQIADDRPPVVYPGAKLVGVARHGHFRRLHSDGHGAAAYDGWTLRWFSQDQVGEAPAQHHTPIALCGGRLLVAREGVSSIDLQSGAIRGERRPGWLRRFVARPQHRIEAWRRETRLVCERHLGEAPPHEADGDAVSGDWRIVQPSANDFAAYEAFGHLGVPLPPALELEHCWVWRRSDRTLHALPRQGSGRVLRVTFDGNAIGLGARAEQVHLLEGTPDGGVIWWRVDGEGKRHRCASCETKPVSVRAIVPLQRGLLVHAFDRLGDYLMRWA